MSAREPEALARRLSDPDSAPHGGESVRAAVVQALGAPESAFWRTDVPPLTAVELSGRAGRWNVRLGDTLG